MPSRAGRFKPPASGQFRHPGAAPTVPVPTSGGGLGPDSVGPAVEAVGPWCVDASRSLEERPGVKDHARVRAFVDAVRSLEVVRS